MGSPLRNPSWHCTMRAARLYSRSPATLKGTVTSASRDPQRAGYVGGDSIGFNAFKSKRLVNADGMKGSEDRKLLHRGNTFLYLLLELIAPSIEI
jgi:hypothetical protein